MGKKGNLQGNGRQASHRNFQGEFRATNIRDNTARHQYEDHDELTNDENFKAGKPKDSAEEMDLRNKLDNLEDQEDRRL